MAERRQIVAGTENIDFWATIQQRPFYVILAHEGIRPVYLNTKGKAISTPYRHQANRYQKAFRDRPLLNRLLNDGFTVEFADQPYTFSLDTRKPGAISGTYVYGQIAFTKGTPWAFIAKVQAHPITGINGSAVSILSISDQAKWAGGEHEIFNYDGRIDTVSERITPALIEDLVSFLAGELDLPFIAEEELDADNVITAERGFPGNVTPSK